MKTLSFCLNSSDASQHIIDQQLLNDFSSQFDSLVQFNKKNQNVNVLISGETDQIRGKLLQKNPLKSILKIHSLSHDVLFHPEIKTRLSKIANEYNIEIKVHATLEPEIHMIGFMDTIELARVQILVALDELSGLLSDTTDAIFLHLHHLISGRKHAQLQSIMEETCTNIYLQPPFMTTSHSRTEKSKIYITADSTSNISRAKELLHKLTVQKSKSMYQKDATMDAKKIDWILLNKRPELAKIMKDNGSYFSFPALGSGGNTVTIFAENRINVERSIRLLNYLTSNVYEASFQLFTNQVSLVERAFGGDAEHFQQILSSLSQLSGADASFDTESNVLEFFGTERQVRSVYQVLCDMPFFKENHQFTTFALELATDQREFISGKKNGKINKIMKACAVTIRFSETNEYNSSVIVESDNYMKALDGLTMLQDELPAETSFYVPEIYHRRIIGVAGKNIQKVMKKYGVYVKFSGAEEFASMGGYFENEDNVVARTPMKNQINLENLRHAVTEFIGFQKDKDYTMATVCIPYWLHRTLPNKYASQLREVCRTNNAKVWWPERVGSNQVVVYGPQSQISAVTVLIEQIMTTEKHIAIKVSDKAMEKVLLEQDTITRLRKKVEKSLVVKLNVQHLDSVFNTSTKKLQWISCFDATNVILYRFICKPAQTLDLNKARTLIKSFVESEKCVFDQAMEVKTTLVHAPQLDYQATTENINLDIMSLIATPPLSEDEAAVQRDLADFHISATDAESILDDLPSPPMSEHQYMQYHPLDRMSSSLLSAPQPTDKNIWASPRMQCKNIIPPIKRMSSMRVRSRASEFSPEQTEGLKRMSSMRLRSRASESSSEHSFDHDQIKMTPSISAPIIGSHANYQQHQPSLPSLFFGGRDLFDALPIRRASSTQHAFEFIPNSTSVEYNLKTTLEANKHQTEFLAHQTPFIYANAPSHLQKENRSQGFHM